MSKTQHWAVSVEVNGENVLTIESNCLSGIESIADHEESVVTAAHHLLAFIGRCRPDAHHVREAAFQQWWKLSAHNGTLPPTRESLAREAYFAAWGGAHYIHKRGESDG